MNFVKKHLFFIICGVVAVGSLGHMAFRITQMENVKREMQTVSTLNDSFSKYTKSPVKPENIDLEERRVDLVLDYHQQVSQHFYERNLRQALMPGLLPDPPAGRSGREMRYDFQGQFLQAMNGFLSTLRAGPAPTAADVDHAEGYLLKRTMEAAQFGGASPESGPAPAPKQGGPAGRPGRQGPASPLGTRAALPKLPPLPEVNGPENASEYWQVLQQQATMDPEMLASIGQARQIWCYADPSPRGGSFDYHPVYSVELEEPNMQKIWFAQLRYWIQKDLVEALAAVNLEAARALPADQEAWVGNMPVKDILSVRISSYIQEESPGAERGTSPGDPTPIKDVDGSFTGEFSQGLYDVLNARLRLAVDARDMPRILNRMCRDNYYRILNVNYTAFTRSAPHEAFRDKKVYGPEPVVLVTIDVQTYLFYKNVVPLMPKVIRDALNIKDDLFEKLTEELQPDAEPESGQPDAGEEESEGNA